MEEEDVTETKHSTVEGETKKVRRRRKKIYQAILQQMEFYFSDANLSKDRFLNSLVQRNPYVNLSVFLKFNKIRALTDNVDDIANSLGKSELLTLSPDRTKVCRESPIRRNYNEDECSIYVENLPPDAKHDWLKDIFSVYGKVVYVSIPKYRQSGKIKGFGFVEFESPDLAMRALKAYGAVGCRLPSDMAPEKLCSVATFEPGEGKNQVGVVENALEVEGDDTESGDAKEDKSEEVAEEEEPEDSMAVSKEKKRRKRKKDQTDDEEAKGEEEDKEVKLEQEESSSPVSKKKKIKKDKGSDEEDKTQGGDEEEENILSPEECSSLSKDRGGKNRKMEEDDEDKEDEDQQLEEGNKKTGIEEESANIEENTDEQKERKKKTRKKKNKENKEKIAEEGVGLQILSKREWKRLRNKYLTLQRKNMKNLRRQIMGGRWGDYWENENGKEMHDEEWDEADEKNIEYAENHGTEDTKAEEGKTKARVQFTPGVIMKIQLQEPLESAKKFKAEVKNLPKSNIVAYVDAKDANSIVYFRCETAEGARDLMKDLPWEDREILEGEEEKDYWDKILQDRDEKITKKIRVKQRGRDKILKKAENLIGKHVRYDN